MTDENDCAARLREIERVLRDLFDAVTAPDAFPVEITEGPFGVTSAQLVENPRVMAALLRAKTALKKARCRA